MRRGPFALLDSITERLRSSLWFIPTLFTVGAIALALGSVALDRRLSLDRTDAWVLFSAGAEGARGVLSTIAGSIITVTGVVFSITIVALQLASTQYTPRVLRSFTEDRATQTVLGVFVGTFTYSLLVLRVVRSEFADFERFVPAISVTVALAMALGSIAALLFFVNHIARSIRVENVMQRIASDTVERIDKLFPEEIGLPGTTASARQVDPVDRSGGTARLRARASGYLQQVREEELLALAERRDIQIEMLVRIGDFLVEGDAIAALAPAAAVQEEPDELMSLFVLGAERTLHQDLARGIIELTDVALRALSPGLNDPTTAIGAVDRLTQVLMLIAQRSFPEPARSGRAGKVRFVGLRPSFDELLRLPFAQLRHSGAAVPAVAERMLESLSRIGSVASPDRRPAVERELAELLEAIRLRELDPVDRRRLERVAELAHEGISGTAQGGVSDQSAGTPLP